MSDLLIGDVRPRLQHLGTGTVTAFAYNFPILSADDITVAVDDQWSSRTTYTVTGIGNSSGGDVVFLTPPANGSRVTIIRSMPISRTTHFIDGEAFRAAVVNEELDRLTLGLQQVHALTTDALSKAPFDSDMDMTLPVASMRAGRALGFDAEGRPTAITATPPGNLAVSGFGETLLAAGNPTAGRSTLGAASTAALNGVTASLNALNSQVAAATPVGTIHPFLGDVIPNGWVELDGKTLGDAASGADHADDAYEKLFSITRSLFPNQGSETWLLHDTVKLPDLRGRAIVGVGQGSGLTLRQLGTPFGAEKHSLTVAELPAHSHGYTYNRTGGNPQLAGGAGFNAGDLTQAGTTDTVGSGAPIDLVPPSYAARWVVWTGKSAPVALLPLTDLGFSWMAGWQITIPYKRGDVVRHDVSGATYIATVDHQGITPHRIGLMATTPQWALVAIDGLAGSDGALTWKGAWSAVTSYVIGDVVTLAGSSYRCKVAHTNHSPPAGQYWDALALKGDTGAQGVPGLLTKIEDDLAPKLGGDLIVNAKKIVSTGNGDIELLPSGSGKVKLKGLSFPTSDGLAGHILRTNGAGVLTFAGPLALAAQSRRLRAGANSASPTSKIDITADELVVKDATGDAVMLSNIAVTVDIAASGVNGLDSGTESASTWYRLWIIYNAATSTVAGLISLSGTAPVLPTGYTYKAVVGSVRNDGAANLVKFYQFERSVIQAPQTIFTGQAGITSWTLQSIANAVPPNAGVISGTAGQSAAAGNDSIGIAADAVGTGACYIAAYNASGTIFDNWRTAGQFRLVLSTTQQVYWRSSTTSAQFRLDINGYEF